MRGMTKRWLTPAATDPTRSIVQRILEARGYMTDEERDAFLYPKLSSLDDPGALPGATGAAEILTAALKEGKRVLIFGDYDADGITAATVLHHIIAAATGREGPPIYIPDRIDEGYGIRPEAIEGFATTGIDLVISVDCGVTAIEAATRAKELGITLIITDHHKPREDGQLPDCAAIVHPSLEGKPATPFAGVGVAYQLAWAFARAWSNSRTVNEKLKQTLLDMIPLVAIGTIADMVPLVGGNRQFARWGLQLLPSTQNAGLKAIMAQLDTPKRNLSASHISFGIAPMINAVGRLAHAATAVDLLTFLDGKLAKGAAGELANLNRKRQGIQREIVAEALEQISEMKLDDHNIIVLQNDAWNRGVVGVAAGRCIETHYRPTILLSGDGNQLVGSARSINGFSIFDALTACKDHLITYGGHDMAAGLTVARDNYDAFVDAITKYAKEHITPEQLIPSIKPDVLADLSEITYATALEIEKIGPFGVGNTIPIIQVMSVPVDEVKTMGKGGSHLSMHVGRSSKRIRCVWWGNGDLQNKIHRGMIVDLVGKVKINEFRGNYSAELDLFDLALPST